jgi:phosphatidylserine/phosphatidylglycerophosphate/cardiolipin synthase-like enzyme
MNTGKHTTRRRTSPATMAMVIIIALFSYTAGTRFPAAQETGALSSAASPIQSDSSQAGRICCFFPRDGQKAQNELIRVIQSADKNLDIAIYSFTDQSVAEEIVKAKKRGVSVRLISDREQSDGKYQKSVLEKLTQAGIPIRTDSHAGIMHLKVTIADSKIATTGSYNYTKSAEQKNDEVFVTLNDPKIASGFEKEFNRMWNDQDNFADYRQ